MSTIYRSSCALNTTNFTNQRGMRRSLRVESLDQRLVLSAIPLAAGGVELAADAEVSLLVDDFNFPPQGTDNTVRMTSNSYIFTTADFGFSDPNNVPPDLFQAVRISSLPLEGTLMAGGAGAAVGQFVSVADIQSGQLQYNVSGVEASVLTNFQFQVQDDGGTANGGSDLDPNPNTFTFILDSPEANFVTKLYQDLFDREPDLGGLQNWLNLMQNGATNLEIAAGLWSTPEHRGLQVDAYYELFFNRTPDAAGRMNWIAQFQGGMTEAEMMAAFMNTTEFSLMHSSNEAFVIAAYDTLFNRVPDSGGQAFWLGELNAGTMTRFDVATGLINTPERHLRLVESYYEDYFRRTPDAGGLAFWTGQLNDDLLTDREVAELLLATPEYFNLQV